MAGRSLSLADTMGLGWKVDANAKWGTDTKGVFVRLPKAEILNKNVVLRILSDSLKVTEWREVRGPDSMSLR